MARVTDGRLTGLVFGLLVLLAGSTLGAPALPGSAAGSVVTETMVDDAGTHATLNTRRSRTSGWPRRHGTGILSRRILASEHIRKLAQPVTFGLLSTTQPSTDRHAGVPWRRGPPL